MTTLQHGQSLELNKERIPKLEIMDEGETDIQYDTINIYSCFHSKGLQATWLSPGMEPFTMNQL